MASAEERVSHGEGPEAVLRDLRKCFAGTYGEAADPAGGDTLISDWTD